MFGKTVEDTIRSKAAKRLRRVDDIEVLDWAQQSVNSLHRSMDALRKGWDEAALQDCRQAVSALAGAVDVLETRAARSLTD